MTFLDVFGLSLNGRGFTTWPPSGGPHGWTDLKDTILKSGRACAQAVPYLFAMSHGILNVRGEFGLGLMPSLPYIIFC